MFYYSILVMKGLIFVILIYALVVGACILVKYLKLKTGNDIEQKNESGQLSAPKIYYVTNDKKPKRKVKKINPDIAIKGSIIDKSNDF